MLKLGPKATGLPAYVVFPENARPDSADIEFAGRFSTAGIRLKYNDKWFKKLSCKQGRTYAFGLDRLGRIVFETSVDNINPDSLRSFLEKNEPSDKTPDGALYSYKDSLEFKFDDQLARLIVSNRYTQAKLYTIRSSTFDLSKIANLLSGKEKEKFLKYGHQLNKELTAYMCRYVSFRLITDSTFLMCLQFYNTPDSISQNITEEFAFVKYSIDGSVKDINLIKKPSNVVFYNTSFISDSHSIYMPFWKLNDSLSNEPDNWDSVKYVARLSINNNAYHIDSVLSQNIPWYYSKRKTYNYLTLTYSSYPYITSYLGNEITNLLDGQTVNILPASQFSKGVDFTNDGNTFDEKSEKFHCYGIEVDKRKNEVIIIYKYGNDLFLNRYNSKLETVAKNRAVEYDFIPGAKFIWVNMYPEINTLTMLNKLHNGDFSEYYLPLDLFY